jgi:hypothetical protein
MWVVNRVAGRDEPRRSPCARRWCNILFFVGTCSSCCSNAVLAQTPDFPAADSNKSWTATTESKADYGNPTRTFVSHTQNGNRTVDERSLQTRGAEGNLTPYQDIETETVRVNATTTRTTTRTFVQDGNGSKTLFQITEERKQSLPGGDSKVERTTSNSDANGNMQVVQREVQQTRNTSPDVEETKTTVMLPSINGGLAPAMQIRERQERSGNTVEIQKTTLLPDGAGTWQVGEVRQSTIKDEGRDRTTEERVSRPDSEGKLQEITRTVGRQLAGNLFNRRSGSGSRQQRAPGSAHYDHPAHQCGWPKDNRNCGATQSRRSRCRPARKHRKH